MKTTKYMIIAMLFAIYMISCRNTNIPDNENQTTTPVENQGNENTGNDENTSKPKKGALVYYIDDEECGGLYYDDKLGDDFESALKKLIESRKELAELGDKLYVKQMEITYTKPKDEANIILLHFFEIDEDNKDYPLKMLYTAHDAIDKNGNHYDVQFCDGPITDPEERKPEGSYSYKERTDHYLVFAKKYGKTIEEAYANLKPEIDAKKAYIAEQYKGMQNKNPDDVIDILTQITVTNCEIKDVTFMMVELHIYSNIDEKYVHFENIGALDSNGNFYYDKSLPVYDTKN